MSLPEQLQQSDRLAPLVFLANLRQLTLTPRRVVTRVPMGWPWLQMKSLRDRSVIFLGRSLRSISPAMHSRSKTLRQRLVSLPV